MKERIDDYVQPFGGRNGDSISYGATKITYGIMIGARSETGFSANKSHGMREETFKHERQFR